MPQRQQSVQLILFHTFCKTSILKIDLKITTQIVTEQGTCHYMKFDSTKIQKILTRHYKKLDKVKYFNY